MIIAFNFVFDLTRIDVFKYIHNFSFELYLVNEPTFVKDSYFKFWATFELVILAIVFRQVDIMGGNTWDPNYAPGLDFLDHIFFNLKNSGQDLSNEGSNFILSSLDFGH